MSWKTKIPLIAILRGIKPEEVLVHVNVLIDAGFNVMKFL